jgi:hypothetical protein
VANNEINATKNAGKSTMISTTPSDAAVRCGAHRPMKNNQGFTQSQLMPPSGKCLCHIAAAAAMVNYFGQKHKTLPKNYF